MSTCVHARARAPNLASKRACHCINVIAKKTYVFLREAFSEEEDNVNEGKNIILTANY